MSILRRIAAALGRAARAVRRRTAVVARRVGASIWRRVQDRIDGRTGTSRGATRSRRAAAPVLLECPDCTGTGRASWRTACHTCRGRGTVYALTTGRSTR